MHERFRDQKRKWVYETFWARVRWGTYGASKGPCKMIRIGGVVWVRVYAGWSGSQFLIGFSENGSYLVSEYINNLNLGGGRNKAGLSLVRKRYALILRGECGCTVFSCSISVTEWPHPMVIVCEIVYVQDEILQCSWWLPGQLTGVRCKRFFFLPFFSVSYIHQLTSPFWGSLKVCFQRRKKAICYHLINHD